VLLELTELGRELLRGGRALHSVLVYAQN
jgi:hypothetical protein